MRISNYLLAGASVIALALPLAAGAQQAPTSPAPGVTSGTVTGANAHPGGGGIMGALNGMTLTPQQHSQIQTIMTQYHQAHPKGSAPDPQARKAMRQQIMGVLTPDEQTTLKERLRALWTEHSAAQSGKPAADDDSDGAAPQASP